MADRFRTRLDWSDVRVFAALARHGGLSAAARALAVNHATVARRFANLEKVLGTKLLERRPTGYILTAAGRQALEGATAMEQSAAMLQQVQAAPAVAGMIRVTATPSMAAYVIARLRPLQEMYPALDFEVTTERSRASLPRHQSDIALRLGRPERGGILGRRVAKVGYGYYATAEWRDRLLGGASPVLIGFDEAGAQFPEARWLAERFRGVRIGFRSNYQTGQIAAACAGLGIAMLPHFLAATEPTLARLSLPQKPPDRELWLLTRSDVRSTQPVRIATEYLVELFRRDRALFEGR
ncbi:MAG TPA: LysR family transcriptional regulator [Pseudolabrys sp.]|nr:LysR family transcriptional regulator [Pseudolabrys sp.]